MAGKTVKIAYIGDSSQLKKASEEVDKQLAKNQSSADKWGKALSDLGPKMMAAGTAIVGGLVFAAKASEEAHMETVKLQNTLANAPALAGANEKAFVDLAQSLQDVTAADGDAIVGAEALLGQFGLTQSQITDLTPLIVDLSRKMGVDLDTAAKMVGKSVEGSSGALKKAGIIVNKNAYDTDHYAATVDALRNTVGGYAEQEGKTFSGSLERAKNQLHDVIEAIGGGAIDAFTSMLGPVKSLTDAFRGLDPDTQSLIGKFGAFAGAGLLAAGALSTAVGWVIKMRTNIGQLVSGAASFGSSLFTLTGALRGLSYAVAAVGLYELNKLMGEGSKQAKEWIGGLTGTVPEKIQKTKDEIERLKNELKGFRSLDIGGDASSDSGIHLFPNQDAVDTKRRMLELQDQLKELQNQTTQYNNQNDLAARGVDEFGNEVEKTDKQLKDQAKAFDAAVESMKNYGRQARENLDANLAARDANQKFADAIAENGRTLDINTEKGRTNLRALEDAIAAWQAWGAQQLEAGANADWVTQQVNNQIGSLEAQYVQTGGNKQMIDLYIASLKATPNDIATQFHMPGLNEAINGVNQLNGLLNSLNQLIIAMDQAGSSKILFLNKKDLQDKQSALQQNIGKRAVGGPVTSGKTYIVGENGPEMLTMGSRSGSITPTGALGAAGTTVNLYISGSVTTENDLIEAVHAGLRRKEVARL